MFLLNQTERPRAARKSCPLELSFWNPANGGTVLQLCEKWKKGGLGLVREEGIFERLEANIFMRCFGGQEDSFLISLRKLWGLRRRLGG